MRNVAFLSQSFSVTILDMSRRLQEGQFSSPSFSSSFSSSPSICVFETEFSCVVQASLELKFLLPSCPECWDYRHLPPHCLDHFLMRAYTLLDPVPQGLLCREPMVRSSGVLCHNLMGILISVPSANEPQVPLDLDCPLVELDHQSIPSYASQGHSGGLLLCPNPLQRL